MKGFKGHYFGVHFWMGLFLLSSLTACVDVRDRESTSPPAKSGEVLPGQPTSPQDLGKDPVSPPKDESSAEDSKKEALSIEVLPLSEPHKYQVIAKGIKAYNAVRKVLPKDDPSGAQSAVVALSPMENQFVDLTPQAGNLKYQFGVMTDKGFEAKVSKDVVVPMDLVVDPAHPLNLDSETVEIRGYGRIYFYTPNLVTYGHNLVIEAHSIEFKNTELHTFPYGRTANTGADGRGGGVIKIKADHLAGRLSVVLRGENGSVGADGAPYAERAKDGYADFFLETTKSGRSICTLGPITPPKRGADGRNGTDGFRGGSSGSLEIIRNIDTQFDLFVEVLPGVGGAAGKGGAGQLGGRPGASRCGGTLDVPPAPNGNPGLDGRNGSDGQRGSVCTRLGNDQMVCR